MSGRNEKRTVNGIRSVSLVGLVCALVLAVPGLDTSFAESVGGEPSAVSPTNSPAAEEAKRMPAIDPKADAVLRQLSEHNKEIKSGKFRVADTIDDVQDDGRKIQFGHTRTLTIVRPDKLKVETTGDITTRTLWKDGKTVTVFDKDRNVYAQIADPGSIEDAIDILHDKYGMSLPAADLLGSDVYKVMTGNCTAVDYIGIGYVGEEKCHHLAFEGDSIDWQMWISAADKPFTRKMVITYKRVQGEPQYTMQVLSVDDAAKIADSEFAYKVAEGVERIEILSADKKR